ncbi:MAG TPA: hypothetical protein VG994_02710 [Steroidobacteraceae bacterium]|nr:hypothetical protein [Steroidobacteraceae bacterium]
MSAAVAARQVEIGGLESAKEREIETTAARLWRAELYAAIKIFALSYIDAENGGRGYDACAARLDEQWGDPERGRGVTGAILKATLNDSERNYFRAEWLFWFATRSPEVADLMARKAKPKKTADERIADYQRVIRGEHSHKRAEAMIREAESL